MAPTDEDPEVLPFGSRVHYSRAVPSAYAATFEEPFVWRGADWPASRQVAPFLSPGARVNLSEAPDGSLGPFPLTACPYCARRLAYFPEVAMYYQEWRRADAVQCSSCRWWLYVWTKVKDYSYSRTINQVCESVVCSFDHASAEEPVRELRGAIASGRIDLRDLTPRELERLVASAFSDATGHRARHVGRSRDGGLDVLVLDGDPPLAVQVKRRAAARSEGPAVVRELIGALAYRGWRRGAVVTTAESFSDQAVETATAAPLAADGFAVDLYTYDALREIVVAADPPPRPWLDLIWDHYLTPEDASEANRRRQARGT